MGWSITPTATPTNSGVDGTVNGYTSVSSYEDGAGRSNAAFYFDIDGAVTPEPATLSLASLGGIMALLARRRRMTMPNH